MGRRAKKAPVQTKKRVTLAKRFKCPFCANEDVVECKMDHKNGTGSLNCRLCGASYQMPIHHLHEPIDVFSEWLDDCEAAERAGTANTALPPLDATTTRSNRGGGYYDDDEDDDDDIDAPSGLHLENSVTAKTRHDDKQQPPQQSYAALGLDDSDDDSD